MSAEAREFLVIVIGALAIVWGVAAAWIIFERDIEEQEAEAERQRARRRYEGEP